MITGERRREEKEKKVGSVGGWFPFLLFCLLFRHPLFSLLRLGATHTIRSADFSLFIPNSAHQQKATPSFLPSPSTPFHFFWKSSPAGSFPEVILQPLHHFILLLLLFWRNNHSLLLPNNYLLFPFSIRLFEPNSIQTAYSEVLHMTTITGYYWFSTIF